MTDNLDGTYTYNYTVSRPGQITVSILQYTLGGVYQEYYASNSFSGNNAYNSTIPADINFNWGSGNIYPSRAIDVSAKFYFRFKAPITGIITFYILLDDVTTMSVGKKAIYLSFSYLKSNQIMLYILYITNTNVELFSYYNMR